jgi:hypothetical protein
VTLSPKDPIQEKGGINLYGFVDNEVINAWDYLGNKPITISNADDITWDDFKGGHNNYKYDAGITLYIKRYPGNLFAYCNENSSGCWECEASYPNANVVITMSQINSSVGKKSSIVLQHERGHARRALAYAISLKATLRGLTGKGVDKNREIALRDATNELNVKWENYEPYKVYNRFAVDQEAYDRRVEHENINQEKQDLEDERNNNIIDNDPDLSEQERIIRKSLKEPLDINLDDLVPPTPTPPPVDLDAQIYHPLTRI